MAEVAEDALKEAMKGLTEPQKRALLKRQLAAMCPDAVFARGATTGALRRRGLIAGAMPYARLTPLGEAVCSRLEAQ